MEMFEKKAKIYDLYKVMLESQTEFLAKYFQMEDQGNVNQIFSSILSFLERMFLYEDQKEQLSDFYRVLLKKGVSQYKDSIKRAVREFMMLSEDIPLKCRFLSFYLDLR